MPSKMPSDHLRLRVLRPTGLPCGLPARPPGLAHTRGLEASVGKGFPLPFTSSHAGPEHPGLSVLAST